MFAGDGFYFWFSLDGERGGRAWSDPAEEDGNPGTGPLGMGDGAVVQSEGKGYVVIRFEGTAKIDCKPDSSLAANGAGYVDDAGYTAGDCAGSYPVTVIAEYYIG